MILPSLHLLVCELNIIAYRDEIPVNLQYFYREPRKTVLHDDIAMTRPSLIRKLKLKIRVLSEKSVMIPPSLYPRELKRRIMAP